MKKAITIIIILLLIAAGIGAAYYFLIYKKPFAAASADKVYVQAVEALQSYGGYGNRYGGIVEAQKTHKTEFDSSGKLNELFVAVGDRVKEGDPLFSYDTEAISLEIDQINLEIDRLNTEIANNNSQIEQLTKDMANVSESDRLEFSAQIAQYQADNAQNEYDVRTKQSEIKKKEAAIENSTVTAAMAGTVISIANVDDIIAGVSLDESGNPSNTFITVQADGNFRLKGKVSETNISDIYSGLEVLARSRVDENQTWTGIVASIDTQHTSSGEQDDYYSSSGDSASKYDFYVELDDTEGLMIGQHLIIEPYVDLDVTSEGIWLDGGWIAQDEDNNPFVWAAPSDGAKLEKRAVKTGRYLEESDQYEILTGLVITDFIAWPDDSCYEGAPTTSEIVIPESDSDEDSEDFDETYDDMNDMREMFGDVELKFDEE